MIDGVTRATTMEPVSFQTMFNLAIGGFGVVAGLLLNAVWQALKDLQQADSQLAEKVNKIETLVVGQYIKRDEFTTTVNILHGKLDKAVDAINLKLDLILDRMSNKLDRKDCIHTNNRNHDD